jgi:hypothetical protein
LQQSLISAVWHTVGAPARPGQLVDGAARHAAVRGSALRHRVLEQHLLRCDHMSRQALEPCQPLDTGWDDPMVRSDPPGDTWNSAWIDDIEEPTCDYLRQAIGESEDEAPTLPACPASLRSSESYSPAVTVSAIVEAAPVTSGDSGIRRIPEPPFESVAPPRRLLPANRVRWSLHEVAAPIVSLVRRRIRVA